MVAVVRGKAKGASKSRARTPARKPSAARAGNSKFRGGQAGLSPKVALYAAGGAMVVALAVLVFTGNRLELIGQGLAHTVENTAASGGFRLTSLQIVGASETASADIAAAAGLEKGAPILGIDLEGLRQRISRVGWVEDARVSRQLPGTIVISVDAREPAAVWQAGGIARVIDADGKVIREADPRRFADLPFIVGDGANEAGGEIFDLVRARPRLAERLEALVRVDSRRWDLRLKDGGIIQLPAVDEAAALIRLDQLDQGQRILDLGFSRIDLRSNDMIVVRKGEPQPANADA